MKRSMRLYLRSCMYCLEIYKTEHKRGKVCHNCKESQTHIKYTHLKRPRNRMLVAQIQSYL